MIRTEILIRAGRQHLSRSILARAVGRIRRRKHHFSITPDGSSAARSSVALFPSYIRRSDETTTDVSLSDAKPCTRLACSVTSTHLLARAIRTLFHKHQRATRGKGNGVVGAPSVRCDRRKQKKKEKYSRHAESLPRDVHISETRWRGETRLATKPLRAVDVERGCPSRRSTLHHATTVQLTSPTRTPQIRAPPGSISPSSRVRDNIVVGCPFLGSNGRCIGVSQLRLRRAERHETPRAAATNQCGGKRRTQRWRRRRRRP